MTRDRIVVLVVSEPAARTLGEIARTVGQYAANVEIQLAGNQILTPG
jgi:predicted transcriptional regulator